MTMKPEPIARAIGFSRIFGLSDAVALGLSIGLGLGLTALALFIDLPVYREPLLRDSGQFDLSSKMFARIMSQGSMGRVVE
jgi:hypothetical protein